MVQQADALVVTDTDRACAAFGAVTSGVGLRTHGASSVDDAMCFLGERSPTLAVIQSDGVGEWVLGALARAHPSTHTVIVSDEIEDAGDLERCLLVAPPDALVLIAPSPVGLAAQLRALLDREVGGLRLERGGVVHGPTGERFRHEVGVRLLLAYPSALHCRRQTGEYMALHRLRQWLRRVAAAAAVVAEDRVSSFYRLQLLEAAEQDAAF